MLENMKCLFSILILTEILLYYLKEIKMQCNKLMLNRKHRLLLSVVQNHTSFTESMV